MDNKLINALDNNDNENILNINPKIIKNLE